LRIGPFDNLSWSAAVDLIGQIGRSSGYSYRLHGPTAGGRDPWSIEGISWRWKEGEFGRNHELPIVPASDAAAGTLLEAPQPPFRLNVLAEPAVTTAAPYPCDAGLIHRDFGIPTLLFGPRGAGAHNPDEYVDLESVIRTAEVLLSAALAWTNT
jgi:acetylornithine deacetylase/succinyl-diaminopimelate desuccinylase-like protein